MTPHPGMPVLLAPRRGYGQPSYAMVARAISPHIVRLIITADSGGRERGSWYDAPHTRLTWRVRGRHRSPRPWWRMW